METPRAIQEWLRGEVHHAEKFEVIDGSSPLDCPKTVDRSHLKVVK